MGLNLESLKELKETVKGTLPPVERTNLLTVKQAIKEVLDDRDMQLKETQVSEWMKDKEYRKQQAEHSSRVGRRALVFGGSAGTLLGAAFVDGMLGGSNIGLVMGALGGGSAGHLLAAIASQEIYTTVKWLRKNSR